MDNNQFSGIPGLADTQGLQNYVQNEQLKSMGVGQPNPQDGGATTQTPATGAAPATGLEINPAQQNASNIPNANTATNTSGQATTNVGITQEQLNAFKKQMDSIQAQLGQRPQAPQTTNVGAGYNANVKAFITEAISRGYSIEQIQRVLAQKGINPQMNQQNARIAAIEKQLQERAYQEYESKFIDKMTTFGNKWGLTEDDLVAFGNKALGMGINVANVDANNLETVFRAVYPEQYAIRLQRMQSTPTSQIYGGTGVPENPNVANEKLADAIAEQFINSHYPRR